MRKFTAIVTCMVFAFSAFAQTPYASSHSASLRNLSIAELEQKVQAGSTDAMVRMAFYLENASYGLKQDTTRAYELLKQAYEAGNEEAGVMLADDYYFPGHVVKPDTALAIEILSKLADKGNASAMAFLASKYYTGTGVVADTARFEKLVKAAVATGDCNALEVLASSYRLGRKPFGKNIPLAIQTHQKAYEAGYDRAANFLINLYVARHDYKSAWQWIEKVRPLNLVIANNIEAGLYFEGRLVPFNEQKGLAISQKNAADHPGNTLATNYLALRYIQFNDSVSYAKAYNLLQSSTGKDGYAESLLGIMYENGYGVDRDYEKAHQYYEKAHQMDPGGDYELTAHALAIFYHNRNTPYYDTLKTYDLLKEAAAKDNELAAASLGDLYSAYDLEQARRYYHRANYLAYSEDYDRELSALFGMNNQLDSAYYYAQKAINEKNADAYLELAQYYSISNLKTALKTLKEGCKKDSRECMMSLADYYARNEDYKSALKYYHQAGATGNSDAYLAIGKLYESGSLEGYTEKALYHAIEYYCKAADLHNTEALIRLGYIYEYNTPLQDYTQSLSYFRKVAAAGHSEGIFKIGLFYELGDGGLPQDSVKAVAYYQKAADLGHDGAKCYLADFYKTGQYLPLDEKKAFELYQEAADNGYLNGIYYVGKCYLMGTGTEIDTAKAIEYIREAALEGVGPACAYMGDFYNFGTYLPANADSAIYYYYEGSKSDNPTCDYQMGQFLSSIGAYSKAIEFYNSAAKNGNLMALIKLADALQNGRGIEADPEQALQLLQYAAQNGCYEAYSDLGFAYLNGIGCTANEIQAFFYFDTAANNGVGIAMHNLSLCYLRGIGCIADTAQSLLWIRRAVEAGSSTSMVRMGNYYEEGTLIPMNYDSAFYYFQKAYDLGNSDAAKCLAGCYEMGHGCALDEAKALEYYQEAASNGSAIANYKLGVYYEMGLGGVTADTETARQYYQTAAAAGYEAAATALEKLPKGKKR